MSNGTTSYGTLHTVRVEQLESSPRRPRRSSRCLRCVCVLSTTSIVIVTCLLVLLHYIRSTFWLGGPRGDPPKQPDLRNETFAVGFDLTPGYGTASVSFRNGSIFNVARIDGDEQYREVMDRLSLDSSVHPTPPYYSFNPGHKEIFRQRRRKWRKWRGFPASEDVDALATVLSQLKVPVRELVSPYGDFHYALLTVPYLPALYNEDLIDACEHVGIQALMLPSYVFQSGGAAQWPVSEINTAYAGMGLGICNDFLNLNATECAKHMNCTSSNNIFSVFFSNDALTAHLSPICDAMHFFAAPGVLNFTLGLNSENDGAFESSEVYWQKVRQSIRQGLQSYYYGRELSIVVSHGELGSIKEFQDLLQDEVMAAQNSGFNPAFYYRDAVFAGARGAAELGKRCMLLGYDCIPDIRPRGPGW